MKSKTREIEEFQNIILIELQHLQERMNLIERHTKNLEDRIFVCEEFKHKTHTGVYATVEDLKAIDKVIKNMARGSA